MWWQNKKDAALAVAVVKQEPRPEPEIPLFGTQAHGLTRFGRTWINLSEVAVVEFNPLDGCGAECRFKNSQEQWHIPDEDARALRTYLEGFESAQKAVDEAQTMQGS